MQHNQKGFILLESLIILFLFTIVLLSFFNIYQHIIKQREERTEYIQAFLIARSELQTVSEDIKPKITFKPPFTVYVELTPYYESIMELNVLVQWEGRRGELKIIQQKKLIFYLANPTSAQTEDILMLN